MACCGDVPTIETLAAVSMLREQLPSLQIRVVNVVDLMTLGSDGTHPHALDDEAFIDLFSPDSPVIFAFHGYPSLIHRLAGKRPNHQNFHVHGYMEEGAATTAFDMTVLNGLDRFTLAMEAIRHACSPNAEQTLAFLAGKLDEHCSYVKEHGQDLQEIMDWQWMAS
jgi:xylulose-5-phosphate/fructose-6-phosphate phosphoketolase